ncbi:MAG: Zn-dependent hydrolase [Desulfobulbaceae bacterium]|nr:Zn-dependent hydrolase [Desulfobulbaceae bacterium]
MINFERFLSSIEHLAQYNDTPDNGVTRLSYSSAEELVKNWLSSELNDIGVKVWTDGIGNLHGLLKGESNKAAILTGSHLDTVQNGGRLDGSYGILAALEILKSFNEQNFTPYRDIEFIAFAEEEGSNFGTTCVGSKSITGNLSIADLHYMKNTDGITAYSMLISSGLVPENLENEQLKPEKYSAYLELHIEQNIFLESENVPIGAVTDIFGMRMFRLCYKGESKHAATPMSGRRDPMRGLIEFGQASKDIINKMGKDFSLTIGQVFVEPNVGNVIPSKVSFTVDLRHVDNAKLTLGSRSVTELANSIARDNDLNLEIFPLSKSNAVSMDQHIVTQIKNTATMLGHMSTELKSGPAHDAAIVGELLPAGLIFVPSIDGLSHCATENTNDSDLAKGVEVYRDVLKILCMQD